MPQVFLFSETEITTQPKFLLGKALFQFSLLLYQRFVQFSGVTSREPIAGNMLISLMLSKFFVFAIAILLAAQLKKKIGTMAFVVVLAVLLLPTTIHETKGALFLLPIALPVPLVLYLKERTKFVAVVPVLLAGAALFSVFIVIYTNDFAESAFGLRAGNVHQTFSETLSGENHGKFVLFYPSKTAFSCMLW